MANIDFNLFASVRAALAMAKVPAALELVESYEEANEPVVVFCCHQAPLEAIASRPGWGLIHGGVNNDKRTQIVEDFQAGKLKGVCVGVKSGGVGITLTHASVAIFIDEPFTPGARDQAQDRIHRIGQERPVQIIRLVADHDLDRRMAEILDSKQTFVDHSVAKAQAPQTETNAELIQRLAMTEENSAPKGNPAPKRADKHLAPSTPDQVWAAEGLAYLNSVNEDRAGTVNGVGFNKIDTDVGESLLKALRTNKGLTEKQWGLAFKMLAKYWRQVGKRPTVEDQA